MILFKTFFSFTSSDYDLEEAYIKLLFLFTKVIKKQKLTNSLLVTAVVPQITVADTTTSETTTIIADSFEDIYGKIMRMERDIWYIF